MIPVLPGAPGSPGGPPLTPAQAMYQAAALGTIAGMSPAPMPGALPLSIAPIQAPSPPAANVGPSATPTPTPSAAPSAPAPTPASTAPDTSSTGITMPDWTDLAIYAAMGIGALAGGYHGYKRHVDPNGRGSIGWGAAWAVLGATVPFIVVPVALIQGYAEPSDSARIARVDAALERLAARYPMLPPASTHAAT